MEGLREEIFDRFGDNKVTVIPTSPLLFKNIISFPLISGWFFPADSHRRHPSCFQWDWKVSASLSWRLASILKRCEHYDKGFGPFSDEARPLVSKKRDASSSAENRHRTQERCQQHVGPKRRGFRFLPMRRCEQDPKSPAEHHRQKRWQNIMFGRSYVGIFVKELSNKVDCKIIFSFAFILISLVKSPH